MKENLISRTIYEYILNNYDLRTPIFIKDIYGFFPNVNQSTIRSIFKRFNTRGVIVKISDGVYAFPNENSFFGKPTVFTSDIIQKKYIGTGNNIIGYRAGINFSNQLGLTTQTASVSTIISNAVSAKKRMIKLNNTRFIVNAPRVEINKKNYKLLQVLDLLNDFDTLSEVNFTEARKMIADYMSDLQLDENETEEIVTTYPLAAQVKFYKIGA